ncbi:MAG TPA: HD domain-containing protein [Caulobacteraceae bacterium]|nr:HD domain-containing protein [Caulobacteraceae bacterium]
MTADSFIDEIFALYQERGHERYGERVTQLDHALQCAALAKAEGAPDALVAAALLHDYGHLIDDRGHLAEREGMDGAHEVIGADALSAWFGPAITQPIALHVAAKRFLCAAEPSYFTDLSPASQLSLRLQGGPLQPRESDAFRTLPFADEAVRLRRWDDWGKALETPEPTTLEDFRKTLRRAAAG